MNNEMSWAFFILFLKNKIFSTLVLQTYETLFNFLILNIFFLISSFNIEFTLLSNGLNNLF